jgi:hypothetical protein
MADLVPWRQPLLLTKERREHLDANEPAPLLVNRAALRGETQPTSAQARTEAPEKARLDSEPQYRADNTPHGSLP